MIRKLRRKFILINMSLVLLVLCIVFGVLLLSTYRNQQREVQDTLRQALILSDKLESFPHLKEDSGSGANGGFQGGAFTEPEEPGPKGMRKKIFLPAFCAEVDQNGLVAEIYSSFMEVSDETAQAAVTAALSADKPEGKLSGLDLQYLIDEKLRDSGARLIAFADLSSSHSAMQRLLLNSVLVGCGGLAGFFLISLLLSRVAVKPVERAWQQQRQFVADASHELKTPITVILANSRILLSHPGSTIASQEKWIRYIQEESQRMKELVEDMLFLAKSDASAAEIPKSRISLSDLVWNCLLPFESVAFEHRLELKEEIAPGLCVLGNEPQLKQLVMILLDNACKYTDSEGFILLSLSASQDKARLCVRNSGESIPAEELSHLFERFYRVDQARSREMGGYGLGLSIARSIVEHHRGKIWAESSKEKGTAFYVEIKLAP